MSQTGWWSRLLSTVAGCTLLELSTAGPVGIGQYRGLSGHGHQVSTASNNTNPRTTTRENDDSGKRRLRRHTGVQFSPYADTRLLTPLVPSLDRHSRHGASLHSVAQPTNTSTHSPTPHNRTPNHSSEPKSKCTRRRIRGFYLLCWTSSSSLRAASGEPRFLAFSYHNRALAMSGATPMARMRSSTAGS